MFKKSLLGLILSVFAFGFLSGQELRPVKWKFTSKKVSDCEYELSFKATVDDGWHLYSLIPTFGDGAPNPTELFFDKSKDFSVVGKPKETKTKEDFDKDLEVKTIYHEKTGTFFQKIKVLKSGTLKIKGEISFQTCREGQCVFFPHEDFSFEIQSDGSCEPKVTVIDTIKPDTLHTSIVTSTVDTIKKITASTGTLTETNYNASEPSPFGDCHPWQKFLLGLLAGLGAVLMPCIYSLIPLTVSFFVKRSKTRALGIRNSLLYGFFIIITFVIPTMLITIIFGPDTLSKIATNTWLNLFFFLLFVVFALSFFGLFEITLPSSWGNKLDAKADKGGVLGIFFMAATLVVVSFSCTAGFLGPLLTALAEGSSYMCPLAGFTGFGSGIALPFMLFAFFPSMLNSLPKSGGWMTTFKVSVAFIELALAVKFLTNADNVEEWGFMTREVFIALWIGIFSMMTFYLLGVFRTSHDDPKGHLSVGRIIFATITLTFTIYLIPGMWGAPLKLISSFPPPHYYAEAPDGFGSHANTIVTNTTGNSEISSLENMRVSGPEGLKIFKDDYDNALKYSKLVKKPLFVDFTGKACVNCRLMESNIWVKPSILPVLRDSVVIVSLYADSKVSLPDNEQKEVMWSGKTRTLKSYGDKWAYLQSTVYRSNAQPLYVVLNGDQKVLSNGTIGTELDEAKFKTWLNDGVSAYKK
ncbi:MAG TPA: cytochrome c biogenesis protein CcdA [Bacteroidia bacterium]|nr:cytochrome c biogenesis protein CcdA [Bacteroidia bacterium]